MMRREFVLSVGTLAVLSPRGVRAQIAPPMRRVAFLGNSTAALESNLIEPFRQGMRELGYVEGRTITIDYRWAEGDYSRFPALLTELLALHPDVIVTAGAPAASAVARATNAVPCVMVAVGDP